MFKWRPLPKSKMLDLMEFTKNAVNDSCKMVVIDDLFKSKKREKQRQDGV